VSSVYLGPLMVQRGNLNPCCVGAGLEGFMILEVRCKVERILTTRLRWLDHEEHHRSAIGWIGPHVFLPAYFFIFLCYYYCKCRV
jgi:hypothetical protein